jgi:hypothetical protein
MTSCLRDFPDGACKRVGAIVKRRHEPIKCDRSRVSVAPVVKQYAHGIPIFTRPITIEQTRIHIGDANPDDVPERLALGFSKPWVARFISIDGRAEAPRQFWQGLPQDQPIVGARKIGVGVFSPIANKAGEPEDFRPKPPIGEIEDALDFRCFIGHPRPDFG